MEEIDNYHFICLMYKLLSTSRDNDDLSIAFPEVLNLKKKN